jgi:hypothetical protein
MATKIECAEHIPQYSPDEVFDVGTLFDTLPKEEGFVLEADSDRFMEGVIVHLGLVVAGHDFRIDGKVTEFARDEHIKILGSSRVGKAAVWLDLAPEDQGTGIHYGISIQHSLMTKFAEPLVAQHLKTLLPRYSAEYKQNVINVLDDRYGAGYQKAV